MSDHAEGENHEKLYWMVGGALFLLTLATVAVSKHHFPAPWGLVIGLAIAVLKSGLVVSIFMHLKWESKYIYYFLGLTVVAAVVLFTLPITDFRLIDSHIVEKADPKAAAVHGSHEGAAPAEHH
ncbi:MAG: hypothetical protein FD126_233 [Elusimicrobia bacterium]|nr:MAG: hypothetical protein FD126_233 [Elusimicrobiota bacterium]